MPEHLPTQGYSRREAHKPERTCVICRNKFFKKTLTRYVMGADGNFLCDKDQVLPGRGWYHCANSTCAARFAKYRPKRKIISKARRKRGQGAI